MHSAQHIKSATTFILLCILSALASTQLAFAQADNTSLAEQLSDMRQQVQQLQLQLSEGSRVKRFRNNLGRGDRSAAVRRLQSALNDLPGIAVAAAGPGSFGNETTYYGPKTAAAVADFQEMYRNEILTPLNLQNGTGYFGPSTRKKLNSVLSAKAGDSSNTAQRKQESSNLNSLSEPITDNQRSSILNDRFSEGDVSNTVDFRDYLSESQQREIYEALSEAGIEPPQNSAMNLLASGCVLPENVDDQDKEALQEICDISEITLQALKSIGKSEGVGADADALDQLQYSNLPAQAKNVIEKVRKQSPYIDISKKDTSKKDEIVIEWDINNMKDCEKTSSPSIADWDGPVSLDSESVTDLSGESSLIATGGGTQELKVDGDDVITLRITCEYDNQEYTDSITLEQGEDIVSSENGNNRADDEGNTRAFGVGGLGNAFVKREVVGVSTNDGSVRLAQADTSDGSSSSGDSGGITPGKRMFRVFGGQTDGFHLCTCFGFRGNNIPVPGGMVEVDDSIDEEYAGQYTYFPVVTTLHRHYEIIYWRWPERCTLGNYNTEIEAECKQFNPGSLVGAGPLCVSDPTAPESDGLLWNIGTSEERVSAGYCGEEGDKDDSASSTQQSTTTEENATSSDGYNSLINSINLLK